MGEGRRAWLMQRVGFRSRRALAVATMLFCLLAGAALAQQKRTVAKALSPDPEPPVPLTKVSAIRALTKERALQRLPVKLRGTITFRAPGRRLTFLSDGTGGISLELTDDAETDEFMDLPPGTKVDVEGAAWLGCVAEHGPDPSGCVRTPARDGECPPPS